MLEKIIKFSFFAGAAAAVYLFFITAFNPIQEMNQKLSNQSKLVGENYLTEELDYLSLNRELYTASWEQ